MSFTALIDANVLWSASLRDTIIRAARADLFQPAWSVEILAELARSLEEDAGLLPARVARTVSLIDKACPGACVNGYQALTPVMTNHPGDHHVLAAAVHAKAEV